MNGKRMSEGGSDCCSHRKDVVERKRKRTIGEERRGGPREATGQRK